MNLCRQDNRPTFKDERMGEFVFALNQNRGTRTQRIKEQRLN